MHFGLKMVFLPLFILSATNASAAVQLTCNVRQDINPPLEVRSLQYVLSVPLINPNLNARIDLNATDLSLRFNIDTFLSRLTSPGEQVILITILNTLTGATTTSDGHGSVQTFYDATNGSLSIQCSVNSASSKQ